ncbi:hypothetical protein PVV74_11685 [Roseovarius sp. SK2]|nr:hypothetical protein [Roseovarius sp. SK2]MDD9726118.1 hypothetical protein [Roseovarius sp. SK2]
MNEIRAISENYLKAKCIEAMNFGQSEVAEAYHAWLIEVEHFNRRARQ